MTITPTRRDLEQLTEPTRSKALDILQRLRHEGYEEGEAIAIAFRQAEEWEATHAPTAATPQESPRLARVRTASAPADHPPESGATPPRPR